MPLTLSPISRRSFLRGALAGAGALAIGSRWSPAGAALAEGDHLALLSDIHLDANPQTLARSINMWDQFGRCRDEILALASPPACVLVNGDCALQRGRPEDYVTVIEGLAPFRQAGLEVHLALGNHDDRANLFKAALPADPQGVAALIDRRVMVVPLRHADWYILDTLDKTAATTGTLGPDQIDWLKNALDARPDRPAIILMHHQPDDRPLEVRTGLLDTTPLFSMLKPRKQAKAVVYGHTHVWKQRIREGIHCINLPTSAYVFDSKQPAGWFDAYVSATSLRIRLCGITPNHPKNGETLDFQWR
jgi:3',5'-cyclic-AMP phosphodiesterase